MQQGREQNGHSKRPNLCLKTSSELRDEETRAGDRMRMHYCSGLSLVYYRIT